MIKRAYGVDLGTSVIKIYKKGKGIVCNEKNIIALKDDKDVLAIGDDAFEMYEKVPGNVKVTKPVKNGVIADIANMDKLFTTLLKNISKNGRVKGADFVVAIPMDITEVEKKAFIDLVDSSKAKNVRIVAKSIAAAVGVGIDVNNAKGAMVVDIGASTTEISIISLGGIVLSKLLPLGGDTFNDAIVAAVKKNYNLLIGNKTASKLKKTLGNITKVSNNVYELNDEIDVENSEMVTSMAVYGRNMITGLPEQVEVDASLVVDAMHEILCNIMEGIKVILERTPPEISSDIIDTGIYIVGGCATINGLDELIRKNTGLRVNICDKPQNCVVDGVGIIMENNQLSKLVCKNVR